MRQTPYSLSSFLENPIAGFKRPAFALPQLPPHPISISSPISSVGAAMVIFEVEI